MRFLDSRHGADWTIWEFRAEGTGYPDSEVYGRIHHFPWPDHHPPPFALIPRIMASMRDWLQGLDDGKGKQQQGKGKRKEGGKRVAVVHCKAGKGRSGTVACSYLVSQEGWKVEDALRRFTERRMRPGFGEGVSIPSQRRWVGYVDRWANQMNRTYIESPVEILEIHVWGLRDGVKVAVEGYVEEGKKIKTFHLFHRSERIVVDDGKSMPPEKKRGRGGKIRAAEPLLSSSASSATSISTVAPAFDTVTTPTASDGPEGSPTSPTTRISAVLLRPSKPVILPTSDVNIDFERRTKAAYTGWTMVTSVAHVWFNAYFEGGDKHDSGVFETEWDALDGIKGSTQKGTRALDRLKVVWRYPPSPSPSSSHRPGETRSPPSREEEKAAAAAAGQPPVGKVIISQPRPGEAVPESRPADWRGQDAFEEEDPAGPSSRDRANTPIKTNRDKITPFVPEATAATATTTTAASSSSSSSSTAAQWPKDLGLRRQTPASEDVSFANNSIEDLDFDAAKAEDTRNKENRKPKEQDDEDPDVEAVRPCFGR